MESSLNTDDLPLETNQPHRETVWPHSRMPRSWSHGGSRRVYWCLGLGDREGTTVKTLVGGYRDSYRQVKRTRLWGFTAVNVHHTAQNISKERTQKILNVLATVTPGRCYLVIAMCTYIKTPHYLLSWWAQTCQKRTGTWECGSVKSAFLFCLKPWVQLPALI